MGNFNKRKISAIIVTHNSQHVIEKCIDSLTNQNIYIFIVDSGSDNSSYITNFEAYEDISVIVLDKNVGFSKANNIGIRNCIFQSDYIVFINPDVFLPPNWIQNAFKIISNEENKNVGILSGPLLGYDYKNESPTGLVDSLGIEKTWFGKWFDKFQGKIINTITLPTNPFSPTAICGALMFCRVKALQQMWLKEFEIFDETFFMYKEDIELSLRISKKWELLIHPKLIAYHCRGWSRKRQEVSFSAKFQSAKNEFKLNLKYHNVGVIYSLAKMIFVLFIERIINKISNFNRLKWK